MKLLSLFSGIGSPEKALVKLGIDFELVGFSEVDKYAIKSYCAIHNVDESLNLGDITNIDIDSLPKDIDVITHGSPCQDFSVAGHGKGGDLGTGTRSSLMWHTVEIVKHCKPKYVIWENVKNVLSKNHVHTFSKYLNSLSELGYENHYEVLNAKDFGVPQNRERLFCISILKDLNQTFNFPVGKDTGIRLRDILEPNVDEKYYVNQEKTEQLLKNIGNKIDLSKQVIGTCHYKNNLSTCSRELVYNEFKVSPTLTATMYKDAPKVLMVNEGVNCEGPLILPISTPDIVNKQQNGRRIKDDNDPMFTITARDRHGIVSVEPHRLGGLFDNGDKRHQAGSIWNTEGLSPCLDTMQGGYRQPCVVDMDLQATFRIRKLTPGECWTLMAFDKSDFEKASKVCSNTQLYKQAGNSIVVSVMVEIFRNLLLN